MNTDKWQPEEDELKNLSAELDEAFLVESSLLSAPMGIKVMSALPAENTVALRLARALMGVVLLGAVCCVALGAAFVNANYGSWDAMFVLRATMGSLMFITAMLLAFAGTSLINLDEEIGRKLSGNSLPRMGKTAKLAVLRGFAVVMLTLSGVLFSGAFMG